MNDVLPPCGGYLPIYIDRSGYMREADPPSFPVVHKETRNLSGLTFDEARGWGVSSEISADKIPAVLQLTSEGGGDAVWVLPDLRDEATNRLRRWKGCYGAWPVHAFSI